MNFGVSKSGAGFLVSKIGTKATEIKSEKLKIFYQSRKLLSELYCSSEFELRFKLQPGDIMMFDNHRLLHGRTAYDANEGMRHLQGCYLEFDATDGKLRHLARKFK